MPRSPDVLLKLFAQKTVVDLPAIREALGGVSAMTAFRLGLWCFGDVHFSRDGSLKATTRRLVHEAPAGATHRELADWLRVRVHNTLLDLVRDKEVSREQVEAVYVYLHCDAAIRQEQLARRREAVAARSPGAAAADGEDLPDDAVVIQVLLALVRHPGSGPPQIVRRLRGHAPPITSQQVHAVFTRYDLGEKGGLSKR